MGNCDASRFENSVDPDQLGSEKPADQDPHWFQLCLEIHGDNWNLSSKLDKIGEECST